LLTLNTQKKEKNQTTNMNQHEQNEKDHSHSTSPTSLEVIWKQKWREVSSIKVEQWFPETKQTKRGRQIKTNNRLQSRTPSSIIVERWNPSNPFLKTNTIFFVF
jgi:hypothetical protein